MTARLRTLAATAHDALVANWWVPGAVSGLMLVSALAWSSRGLVVVALGLNPVNIDRVYAEACADWIYRYGESCQ